MSDMSAPLPSALPATRPAAAYTRASLVPATPGMVVDRSASLDQDCAFRGIVVRPGVADGLQSAQGVAA